VQSNLLYLLAAKQRQEGRNISFRSIARETGLTEYTVRGFAHNTLREYPVDAITALCHYFGCEVGDLLRLEEIPEPA